MERVLAKNDIIALDNERSYLVIHTLELDGIHYVMLTDIKSQEEGNIKILIARETLEDEDFALDLLTNEEEIEPILKIMQEQLKADNE
ncbi:MAG: DUF1292 domain-containing protein [Clostridiales bacterium]|nr:DUF1292 domain-containing protein [Clostridiales bacterium]